jgi:hypothetical protein
VICKGYAECNLSIPAQVEQLMIALSLIYPACVPEVAAIRLHPEARTVGAWDPRPTELSKSKQGIGHKKARSADPVGRSSAPH